MTEVTEFKVVFRDGIHAEEHGQWRWIAQSLTSHFPLMHWVSAQSDIANDSTNLMIPGLLRYRTGLDGVQQGGS